MLINDVKAHINFVNAVIPTWLERILLQICSDKVSTLDPRPLNGLCRLKPWSWVWEEAAFCELHFATQPTRQHLHQ